MRAKEILLTVLLVLLLAAVPFAVSHGTLQQSAIDRYSDLYQPEEYSFINSIGKTPADAEDAEDGIPDFGDDDEEEDWGIDFGDDE